MPEGSRGSVPSAEDQNDAPAGTDPHPELPLREKPKRTGPGPVG